MKQLYEVEDMSGGLNIGAKPHLINENEVQDCQNVDFLPGQVATCKGYSSYDAFVSDGIYTHVRRDGTTHLVQQVGEKLYVDGMVEKEGIVGKLSFITYQDLLFCMNVNTMFTWDGLTKDWGVKAPSTACTAEVSTTAGNPNEERTYYVTFVNGRGQESNPSPVSNSVTPTSKQVDLTNIPTGDSNIAKRRIYCSATVGNTTDTWMLVEIPDNTTTTYTDNMVGSELIIGNVMETDNDPPIKSSYLLEHDNRLFLAQGSMLYFSKLGKPEAFPKENYILCNDTGDVITGLKISNDWIVIFKERSILMLSTEGEPSSWNLKVINSSRGCPYPDTIQSLDNSLVFMGYDDLYQIQPTLVQDERSVLPIGSRIKPIIDEYVKGSNPQDGYDGYVYVLPISVDYDGRYWLKIGDKILIFDYRRNCFTKYLFPDSPKCFHITPKNELLFGTMRGTMKYGSSEDFNGDVISAFVIGKDIDMGARSQLKRIKKIFTYYRKEEVSNSLYIQVGTDANGYTEKIYIGASNGYMEWGSGLWGQLWGGQTAPGMDSHVITQRDNYFRIKIGCDLIPTEFYGYGVVYKLKPVR